jgi:hypothetical protein
MLAADGDTTLLRNVRSVGHSTSRNIPKTRILPNTVWIRHTLCSTAVTWWQLCKCHNSVCNFVLILVGFALPTVKRCWHEDFWRAGRQLMWPTLRLSDSSLSRWMGLRHARFDTGRTANTPHIICIIYTNQCTYIKLYYSCCNMFRRFCGRCFVLAEVIKYENTKIIYSSRSLR